MSTGQPIRRLLRMAGWILPMLTFFTPAAAQPVFPPPFRPLPRLEVQPDEQPGTRFPLATRRATRLFRTAIERRDAERYDDAILYFQTILDAEADGFLMPDETAGSLVSLRSEVVRRLEALPDDAKAAYELRYGDTAKALLNEAVTAADSEKLAALVRRFPTTKAGREATYRLALTQLDRGQTLAAVQWLERCRQDATFARRPALLLRLAGCYSRLGDDAKRDAAFDELASLGSEIRFRDAEIAVGDLDFKTLWQSLSPGPPAGDAHDAWCVAGGNPGRTGFRRAASGRAAHWSANALPDPFSAPAAADESEISKRLHKWAAQTALFELAEDRTLATTAQPVAAGGTVFFRTPANLIALDLETGQTRWRTLADPLAWDYLTEAAAGSANGEAAGRMIVGQRLRADATWGRLATDGRVVFSVEETGSARPLPPPPGLEENPDAVQLVLPAPFNRLAAYDAATGRRIWEAGGPADEQGVLAGAFFLGPPVPIGGTWFVLADRNGSTELVAFDPKGRDLLWTQPVAEQGITIDRDQPRRTAGLSPCLVGGLLICPVGHGLIVAVEPATRSLVWAWPMNDENESDEDDESDENGAPAKNNARPIPPPERPWHEVKSTTAGLSLAAANDRALVGPGEGTLAALDAATGRLLWKSYAFDYVDLLGVDATRAYLQVTSGVVAVRLSDGTPAWQTPAAIGAPSGRGVIIGERIYVPLADATLAVLDTATGQRLESRPAPQNEPLGNLITIESTLVSQSSTRIDALPVVEAGGAEEEE